MKKNKPAKLARSSQKDNKENSKCRKKDQYSSAIYDNQNIRNSNDPSSPRPNQFIEKYKTYMQFITSNKIQHNNTNKNTNLSKKKIMTPTPRKNSPIPYYKGRKSAFSRLAQINSPKNSYTTQRNSFPKTTYIQRKQNVYNSFYIHGSNIHSRKKSDQLKNFRAPSHSKQKSNREKLTNSKDKDVYANQINAKNTQHKRSIKSNSKDPYKPKKKKKQKSSINKSSLQSQRDKNLDKDEEKLIAKLFKGIQFYRDLGKGAHALVKSAVDWNNKRKIAIKVYEKIELTDQQLRSIEREIKILQGINHPNIVKLYDMIETFKTINLVMEYGGGNSLDQYIKSKPNGFLCEKQARQIFRQALDAVGYLHKMNITHRDIKTENILLNKHLNLKIIDFGFSLICPPNKNIGSYCGTPTYMAPEVVSKTPHNPQLADRWSLGILLYTILNGHCPFRASTQKQLFQKIIKKQYQYETNVSKEAQDLIDKLLKKDPNQRLNPYDALKHPWFNS